MAAPVVTADGKFPGWTTKNDRRLTDHIVGTMIAAFGVPCRTPAGVGVRFPLPKEMMKAAGFPFLHWTSGDKILLSEFAGEQLPIVWCVEQLLPLFNMSAWCAGTPFSDGEDEKAAIMLAAAWGRPWRVPSSPLHGLLQPHGTDATFVFLKDPTSPPVVCSGATMSTPVR